MALESSICSRHAFFSGAKSPFLVVCGDRRRRLPARLLPRDYRHSYGFAVNCAGPSTSAGCYDAGFQNNLVLRNEVPLRSVLVRSSENLSNYSASNPDAVEVVMRRGVVLVAMICGVLFLGCKRVFAVESVVNAGYGVIGQSILLLRNAWPKVSQVLIVFKEQGLVLALLFALSAFFSMAETSITTLWPWKVELLALNLVSSILCNF